MLLLSSTSDVVQVVTSSAGKIDVHADYMDYNSAATPSVSGGRVNTSITTATTTTVLTAPASGVLRNLKDLKVGNNSSTVTNTVSIQHTDGTNVIVLEQAVLAPLERMSMDEGGHIRVFDAVGREKVPNLGNPTGAANVADVTANAAATYLSGASLFVGGRLQAGSYFKWRLRATKTAAGTATPTIAVATGSTASTSDTSRVTHTGAAQTAATDTAHFEVDAIFRAVGASAVIESFIRMDHTAADGAGLGTFRYLSALSSSFSLGASDYIGLICNPGTSGVWTFQHILIDAGNLLS